jgi:hypothetical protein
MVENECCICYENNAFHTSCDHCICKRCIIKLLLNTWGNVDYEHVCPLCRKEMHITCYYNHDYFILEYDSILIKIEVDFFSTIQTDGNSMVKRSKFYSGGLVWGRTVTGRLSRNEKFHLQRPIYLKSIICKTQ